MKKILIIVFLSFIFLNHVLALDIEPQEIEEPIREQITLVNCMSATTSWVNINGVQKRIRMLVFDPSVENTSEVDKYVCDLLKNAQNLEIERDIDLVDKYNRELVWLYIDGVLLQESLIKQGYGQVNYVTNDYKYLNQLCEIQKEAIINKIGIWSNNDIQEVYCNSGVERNKEEQKEEQEITEEKKLDIKELKHIVFLSSGILLMLIVLVYVRKYAKR